MNNWRRFKEKLTIWVIRFSTEARMKYWGLTNLSAPDAKNVVGLLQASFRPAIGYLYHIMLYFIYNGYSC